MATSVAHRMFLLVARPPMPGPDPEPGTRTRQTPIRIEAARMRVPNILSDLCIYMDEIMWCGSL